MSVHAMSRAKNSKAAGNERLVLWAMADLSGGDFDICFASIDRIAADCRISARSVIRHVAALMERGDLASEGVHPKYRTNQYRVMPTISTSAERGMTDWHPPDNPGPAVSPELKELGSDLGSVGSSLSVVTTAPAADAAVDNDPFPAEDWRFLLDKLHRQGWTAKGSGALTWRFLMRQRIVYGSRIVDSALRDCTYNESAPALSSAAYFQATCERWKAVAS